MQFDKNLDQTLTWKHCHGAFIILIDSGADEKLAVTEGCDFKLMKS